MLSPRERALSYLHGELDRWPPAVGGRPDPGPADEGRITGAVNALSRVGLLSPDEAAGWSARLLAPSSTRVPEADRSLRRSGAVILSKLLDAIPTDEEITGVEYDRFQGAVEALGDVGAVDAEEWDALLRERLGRPSAEDEFEQMRVMNAGGTEEQLLEVIAGPTEPVDGVRILYALRFEDGISLVGRREPDDQDFDESDAEGLFAFGDFWLRDDLGNDYSPASFGTGDQDFHASFGMAPPPDASYIELVLATGNAIRLAL